MRRPYLSTILLCTLVSGAGLSGCFSDPLGALPNAQVFAHIWPQDDGTHFVEGSLRWSLDSLTCASAEPVSVFCGHNPGFEVERYGESHLFDGLFDVSPYCYERIRFEVTCPVPRAREPAVVRIIGHNWGEVIQLHLETLHVKRQVLVDEGEQTYRPGERVAFHWWPASDGADHFEMRYRQDGSTIGTETVRYGETPFFTVPANARAGPLAVIATADVYAYLEGDEAERGPCTLVERCHYVVLGVQARTVVDIAE
jgi:hypothetical protein